MKSAILCITLALLITTCISCGKQQEQEVVVYKGKTLDQWIEQVQTGGYRSCMDAMMAIGECGPKASRARPILEKIVKEPDFKEFKGFAEVTLTRIDPKAKDAVPDLIKALRSPQDNEARMNTIRQLNQIGSPAASATPELIHIVRTDQDRMVRLTAVRALGQIGQGGEDLVPKLLQEMRKAEIP
ncbi:MAG TPA: HEAT repeat domain-containing protein [bacterium]|nr:HEAT repeat domain-containing protein [bacterium]